MSYCHELGHRAGEVLVWNCSLLGNDVEPVDRKQVVLSYDVMAKLKAENEAYKRAREETEMANPNPNPNETELSQES